MELSIDQEGMNSTKCERFQELDSRISIAATLKLFCGKVSFEILVLSQWKRRKISAILETRQCALAWHWK